MGAECSRGVKYARSEISDPRRIFTSTVKVKGGGLSLVPVRSDKPIKKDRWKQAADLVKCLEVGSPVGFNETIKKDFTEKGINLITSRRVEKA
jgi:CxxC motif-containing protein